MSGATHRSGPILGALAASLALLAPAAARAGAPATGTVLQLLTGVQLGDAALRDATSPALALKLAVRGLESADDDDGPPLPDWLRRWFTRWDPYDGTGYRLRPGAGARDGWFVVGALERPTLPEPLVVEPMEEPDSPRRRILGEDAHGFGVVLDLSEIPHLLVALGAGGGPHHLHAYLGRQVTVGR